MKRVKRVVIMLSFLLHRRDNQRQTLANSSMFVLFFVCLFVCLFVFLYDVSLKIPLFYFDMDWTQTKEGQICVVFFSFFPH